MLYAFSNFRLNATDYSIPIKEAASTSTVSSKSFNPTTTSTTTTIPDFSATSADSNCNSPTVDCKPHQYQYRLLELCAVAQYSLERLLDCLSLKACPQSEGSIEEKYAKALSDVYKKYKKELKGCNNLFYKGPRLIYEVCHENKVKEILNSSSFDITPLITLLKKIKDFDISDPCMSKSSSKCVSNEHTENCCSICIESNHLCSKCGKKKCELNRCCEENESICAHPCTNAQCDIKTTNCSKDKDQYVCCEECQLCRRCLHKTVKIDEIIKKLVKGDKITVVNVNGNESEINVCETFLLRLFVGLLGNCRNLTNHWLRENPTQMNDGIFKDPSLPSFCTSWDEIQDVFQFAIQHILKYLQSQETITESDCNDVQKVLRNITLSKTESDLKRISDDIKEINQKLQHATTQENNNCNVVNYYYINQNFQINQKEDDHMEEKDEGKRLLSFFFILITFKLSFRNKLLKPIK